MSQQTRSFQKEIIGPILRCKPEDKRCWGPASWKALDTVCDLIPCDACREHCHSMISFNHDMLNRLQEKPLFDENNVKVNLRLIKRTFPEVTALLVS